MKNHLIDVVLTPEALTDLTQTIAALNTGVAEFALSMDRSQRKRHAKLGLRNETFSRAILDLAAKKPDIVPATIDVAAVQRDLAAREQLLPLLWQLKSLILLLENTTTALGIDIYEATRGIYKAAKITAGISGTSAVLQEIGKRFANQGRRKQAAQQPIPVVAKVKPSAPTPRTRPTREKTLRQFATPLPQNAGSTHPLPDHPEAQLEMPPSLTNAPEGPRHSDPRTPRQQYAIGDGRAEGAASRSPGAADTSGKVVSVIATTALHKPLHGTVELAASSPSG
jgi:hypothetical protein